MNTLSDMYYMNAETGEITDEHKEAVKWYRDGDNVEIYRHNELRCVWEH